MILGGCIGHALCTGLAVLAGRVVAAKISARTGKSSVEMKMKITCLKAKLFF